MIPSPCVGEPVYLKGDLDSIPADLSAASSSFLVGNCIGALRWSESTLCVVLPHMAAAFFTELVWFSLSAPTSCIW